MNDLEKQERLFDLLSEQAVGELNEENKKELDDLLKLFPEWRNDQSFALTAAAINLAALPTDEAMPVHLKSKILAESEKFFTAEVKEKSLPRELKTVETASENAAAGGFFERLFNINWLGWAVAGAACVALALNLWLIKPQRPQIVQSPPPTATPLDAPPTLTQQREQLVASASDVVSTVWSDFDPKKPRGVEGDVVWSNSQQKGFVRFRGLPANDKAKESYQLWIFDADQKNPVSGGVFDANEAGEIVIPIDAELKIRKPTMFAVTAEKAGGVVVSELGKVMAVAKV